MGNHTITVFASGAGNFVSENTFYVYDIGSSSSVNFTIDSLLPTISFTTIQNKTYDTAKVVLDFSVNKPVSQILYSLDNQANVTNNSNVSLALDNLPNGEHNVTIYAKDQYGVISAPNTMYFSVKAFSNCNFIGCFRCNGCLGGCWCVGLIAKNTNATNQETLTITICLRLFF